MAWPARTWIAGELVTAALGNSYWRDPLTDLRAGGLAIASQATNDFLYASSASQLGRVAAVDTKVPRYTTVGGWAMVHPNELAWPVGSVYESVVPTNPATLLGVGTWSAFGTGRVTVAIDAGQTEFDTVEETGGAKTVTLSVGEIPPHHHTQQAPTTAGGTVQTAVTGGNGVTDQSAFDVTTDTGGGGAHNNLPPYIVVYRWKRTA